MSTFSIRSRHSVNYPAFLRLGGCPVPDHDLYVSCWHLPPGSHQPLLESPGSRSLAVEVLLTQGCTTLDLYRPRDHASPWRPCDRSWSECGWQPGRSGFEIWLHVGVSLLGIVLCKDWIWALYIHDSCKKKNVSFSTDIWKAVLPADNSGFPPGQPMRLWPPFFCLWCPHPSLAMPCSAPAWSSWTCQ